MDNTIENIENFIKETAEDLSSAGDAQNDRVSIKIPIKNIVTTSMEKNGCRYLSTYVDLLRKYFIACLNLGFLVPEELLDTVDKFTNKIKKIDGYYPDMNKLDHYLIKGNTIYIDSLLYSEESINIDFELEFFKATTEILFNSNDEHIALNNILCEMVAEKIANMAFYDSKIIFPKTEYENICETKFSVRTGYQKYNLLINLFKQFCIMSEINENRAIRDAITKSYENALCKYFDEFIINGYSSSLDSIFIFEIMRKMIGEEDPNEIVIINEYQQRLAASYIPSESNFAAFCALVTSNELLNKILESVN